MENRSLLINSRDESHLDYRQGSVDVTDSNPLFGQEVTWLEYFNATLDCGRFTMIEGPPASTPCGKRDWVRVGRYAYHRKTSEVEEFRIVCRCGRQYDVAVVKSA